MEARDILGAVRSRWIPILLIVIACLSGAVIVTLATPKTYTATAEAFVSPTPASNDPAGYAASQFVLQRIPSYAQLVSTAEVLDPVIVRMGLRDSRQQLARRVKATNPVNTVVLKVSADDRSPRMAAELADAVLRQLAATIERLEAAGTSQQSPVHVALVTPATPPNSPSSPDLFINLAIGVCLGLVCGFWSALLLAVRRQRPTTFALTPVFRGSASVPQVNGRRERASSGLLTDVMQQPKAG
jgi:polysaccharide biosynthesis transport protein